MAELRLSGHVVDENNAPLAGALVTVVEGETRRLHAFSDPAGAFTLAVAAAGDYAVEAEKPGYFALKNHVLQVGPDGGDFTLVLNRVRDVLESAQVSAVSSDLDPDTPASEHRLTSAELLEIPYPNNNNLRNAMRTLPNVIQDNRGEVHVNGGAERDVLYTLNGFNVADPLTGGFDARFSVEAVQSMNVITTPVPAEFGKGASGVVAVETKMGDDRLRFSSTNFIPGVEHRKGFLVGSWTPRFNVYGPLRRGRAWFSDSVTLRYNNDVVRELPRGRDQNWSWRYGNLFRTQINLTPSNILHAGLLADFFTARRSGLSALDPPETTVDRRAHQYFADVKDQIYFTRGALIEFGYASNRTLERLLPQGHELYVYTPFGRRGNYFVEGSRTAARDQWLTNFFLPSFERAGSHQIKLGIDLDRLEYRQDMRRTGFLNLRTDNSIQREVLFGGRGRLSQTNFETSSYVQDSWRMRPGLLADIGVRADWDDLLRNWNVGPRAGFAWSPFGSELTKVFGGYGIVYNATNLALFTQARDQFPVITVFPKDGAPIVQATRFLAGTRALDSPRYQNWSAGIGRELPFGLLARAEAAWHRGTHGLTYVSLAGGATERIYALADEAHTLSDTYTFAVRQNLRKQYEWSASYTRALARSNAVIDVSPEAPLIVEHNSGRLPWDTPHRFLSWGFLPTFWNNWSIAYLLDWRSGLPFSIRDEQGRVIGDPDSLRFPQFFELDLHAERQFSYRGQRLALRLGMNNVTNHRNPNTVNNDVQSPEFLRYYGSDGRALNFRVRWLGRR